MAKTPRTNFARISSWGPDGIRMDCEGGPLWVLEMAAMQLLPTNLDKLIQALQRLKTRRDEAVDGPSAAKKD